MAPRASRSVQAEDFLLDPLDPEENEEVNVEDLIYDNLMTSEKKMELLDETSMGRALENFVTRGENNAIATTVAEKLQISQTKLMSRGKKGQQVIDKNAIKELCMASSAEAREKAKLNDDATKRREAAYQRRKERKMTQVDGDEDEKMDDSDDDAPKKKRKDGKDGKKTMAATKKRSRSVRADEVRRPTSPTRSEAMIFCTLVASLLDIRIIDLIANSLFSSMIGFGRRRHRLVEHCGVCGWQAIEKGRHQGEENLRGERR